MVAANTQYIIFDFAILAFVIVDFIRVCLVCGSSKIRHKQLGVYAVKLAMWLVCSIIYHGAVHENSFMSMIWVASAIIFSVAAFCQPYIKELEDNTNQKEEPEDNIN